MVVDIKLCLNQVNHQVRLDHTISAADSAGVAYPSLDLEFIDDTGCEMMMIYDTDMKIMMGADGGPDEPAPYDHLMGYHGSLLADGRIDVTKVFAAQVNIIGTDEHNGTTSNMVRDWTTIACSVAEPGQGLAQGIERLNGVWVRSMLYVGSAPTKPIPFYASRTKKGLLGRQGLPNLQNTVIPGPIFRRPNYAALWDFDTARNIWTVNPDYTTPGLLPSEVIP